MTSEMQTHICGIPCIIRITSWEPYKPAKTGGCPDSWMPSEGGYGDWEVCDTRGKPAPWLAKKITPAIQAAIDEQVFEYMESSM